MSEEAYFRNVSEIGDLCLKRVFFEFESEPILFLCENQDKQSYLCLCSEIRYELKSITPHKSAQLTLDGACRKRSFIFLSCKPG